MSITMPCPRCREAIVATDEDDLVRQVREHAHDHGGAHGTHIPSREHVLAHLRDQNPMET